MPSFKVDRADYHRYIAKGGQKGDTGQIEFIAAYVVQGRLRRLHEKSQFQGLDGDWFYVDGVYA